MEWLRLTVDVAADDEDFVTAVLTESAPGGGCEILDRRAALLVPDAGKLKPGRILVRLYLYPEHAEAAVIAANGLEDAVLFPLEALSDEWKENWKKFFKPTRVSERFVVRPPWEAHDAPLPTDIEIVIEPGMAFGTGTHETTRLCLRALDQMMRPGLTVLDVGTGSGVLSVAAAKLGASRIVAIDVEADSLAATLENAERNGVAAVIAASLTPLEDVPGRFELVVANILATVLVEVSETLVPRLAPGGVLLLSGILDVDAGAVTAEYLRRGLEFMEQTQDRDWVALRFRAPS